MTSELRKNIVSSVIRQIITIVYGFIIPRMILTTFGSETNGLINSITQFLQMIAYLDLGVTAVVQSTLYPHLYNQDYLHVSEVLSSAKKFYRNLARILLVYVVVLVVVYPITITSNFDFWYVSIIIVSLALNSFAQYYFGIVNTTLLKADQKGYIVDYAAISTYIANAIIGYMLINCGASIQLFEVVTSVIFIARPLIATLYVKQNYCIDEKIEYTVEPIKQKWNGIAQHFAAVIIDATDIVVLTLFSTLQNVSIYSVYNLVATGVRSLLLSVTNGLSAHFGKIIASNNKENVYESFRWMEWVIDTLSIIVFGCTSILIVPFIVIYTDGVNDADYVHLLFGVLLAIAQLFRCIRLPYNIVILAGGHYKQTQINYIVASAINIITSIIGVYLFGLVGVAIGTVAAFVYQDIWMAYYVSKNIVCWPFRCFLKQNAVNVLIYVFAYVISSSLSISTSNYYQWVVYAAVVFVIWVFVSFVINYLFYKENIKSVVVKGLIKIGRK